MKKKGSSLIFTLCVVAMLTTLTLILVSEASVAYTATSNNEKKDKTSLMAESGVQMGINKLKDMLSSQDSASLVKGNGAISGFTFNDNGEKTDVSFVNNYNCDGKNTIKITSTSTLKEKTRTINAYVSKDDISNPYYDFMKNYVLTVLDKKSNNNTIFKTKILGSLKSTPIHSTGNMYLQGGRVQYDPTAVVIDPVDNIYVNANNLSISLLSATLGNLFDDTFKRFKVNNGINTYICDTTTGGDLFNIKYPDILNLVGGTLTNPKEYDILKVNSNDPIGLDHPDAITPDILGLGRVYVASKKVIDKSGTERLVAVVKVNGDCVLPELENYVEIKLFIDLFNEYRDSHDAIGLLTAAARDLDAANYALNKLDNLYKVYIVNGNVQIFAEPFFVGVVLPDLLSNFGFSAHIKTLNGFDKFLIYSTGKVTFGAPLNLNALSNLTFTDCSIMANQVEFNNLDIFGIDFRRPMDDTFKQIYDSFVKNLFESQIAGYGDEFSFKIYKWEEK